MVFSSFPPHGTPIAREPQREPITSNIPKRLCMRYHDAPWGKSTAETESTIWGCPSYPPSHGLPGSGCPPTSPRLRTLQINVPEGKHKMEPIFPAWLEPGSVAFIKYCIFRPSSNYHRSCNQFCEADFRPTNVWLRKQMFKRGWEGPLLTPRL